MRITPFGAVVLSLATLAALPPRLSADVRADNGALLDKTRMRVVRDTRGDRLLVWVTCSGVEARERPGALSAENHRIGPPLEFLRDVAVAQRDVPGDDRQLYALLIVTTPRGDGVRDIIGWIDQRYLLMRKEPMREPETQILLKLFVVMPVDSVNEGLQKYRADRQQNPFGAIEPRVGPSHEAAKTGELIRLFNLFFVYGKADDYTLVGRRPLIVPVAEGDRDAARRVILGWLPNDRVIPWRTREATYWAPDTGAGPHRRIPGEVFATPRDAAAALQDRAAIAAGRAKPIMVEEEFKPGLYGRPLSPQQMRFPILDEREPVRSMTGNFLMKVGTIGSFRRVGPGDRVNEVPRERVAFGTELSPETVQQLVARGVDIHQLKSVQEAQIFQEGYVWRRNAQGQDQLRDYLLISRSELNKFCEITAGLDLSVEQLGSLTAKQFITRMLDAMGGEAEGPDKSLSLSELVRKRSGYPVQSPLFKNLRADAEDFQLKAQEVADIQWKRAKLRDIRDGKQRDWRVVQQSAGGGITVDVHVPLEPRQAKESRGFYFQGDDTVLWYWIDLKDEWP
jgi:hypothetical protein